MRLTNWPAKLFQMVNGVNDTVSYHDRLIRLMPMERTDKTAPANLDVSIQAMRNLLAFYFHRGKFHIFPPQKTLTNFSNFES